MKAFLAIIFQIAVVSTSYAQQIFGEDSLCNGSVRTYWIDLQANMTQVLWLPPNGGSIFQWSPNNDSIQMQWNSNQDRILRVKVYYNDGSSSIEDKPIYLFNQPDPKIRSDYSGGCGEIDVRKEGDVIQVINENTFSSCQVVCENALVRYYALSDLQGSSFSWLVSNPSISSVTQYPNGDSLDVLYTGTGELQIFLNEISAQGCEENVSFCVEVIEVPEARIATLIPLTNNVLEVCLNQTVEFIDESIAFGNSPIVGNSWYFYDYVNQPVLFSGQEIAQYLFDTPGDFQIILETVNHCGCNDFDTLNVLVHQVEGAIIDACICPKCENDTTSFHSPSSCGDYLWSVDGGSIIQGQSSNDVSVVWDQITASGYATVFLECLPSACPVPTAISFPIITDQAQIEGATTICVANESKIYEYEVPFWQGVSYTWGISPPISNGLFGSLANQSPNKVNLEILPNNTQTQYTIWVAYEHSLITCSGTDTIVVDILPKLGISGDPIVCVGQQNTWYANPRSASTNYKWYINGVINNSFQGDSLVYTANTAGQYNISLMETSYCNEAILSVKALAIPPAPQAINGETDICLHFAYTYTTVPSSSNYFIDWMVIDGTDTIYDQGSSITFQWHSNSGPYIIEARQIFNNGSCPSLPVQLVCTQYSPPTPIINGPDTVCANSTATYYMTSIERYLYSEWEAVGSNAGLTTLFNMQDTLTDIQFGNTSSNQYQAVVLRFKSNICGINDQIDKTIYVGPAPSPVIDITGGSCPGEVLSFTQTNTSLTSGNYTWNFGDGTPGSSLENPSHTYQNGGTYFVNLTITSPNACLQSVSASKTINILDRPVASASLWAGDDEYCLPTNANEIYAVLKRSGQFNPTYQYHWYYSGTAAVPNLTHIIAGTNSQNTYTVNEPSAFTTPTVLYYGIIAIDTNGCWGFDAVPITIKNCDNCTDDSAVDIHIGFERNCQSVQFRDTILPNPLAVISQTWNFNYQNSSSSAHDPSFSYPHSGMYKPSFKVVYYGLDANGNIDSSEICFKRKELNVPIPMLVNFDARFECNAAGNMEIEWLNLTDFVALEANGDGTDITFTEWQINNSQGANVYTGTTPPTTLPGGAYTVKLTHHAQFVNSNYAINLTDTCSKTKTIIVPEPANANFVIDTNISCQNNALFFTNLSTPTNTINSYYWNFGDGQSSLLQNPVKSYEFNVLPDEFTNAYLITLTISDKYGCNAQYSNAVSIHNNYLGGIITPAASCGEATIQFGYDPLDPTVYNTPYYYNWSTDTTTVYPTNYLLTHQTGAYWLEIEDQHGCTKNIGPEVVDIPNTPMATISGPNKVCYGESFIIKGPGGANLSYQWFYKTTGAWLVIPGETQQNLNNSNYTSNVLMSGGFMSFKLQITYTDPQTTVFCIEDSEELKIEYLAKLPVPYIIPVASSCQLPAEIALANPALLNQYNIIWSNGENNVSSILASYYGFFQTTLLDSNSCSSVANITLQEPYPFYELPTGCYDICGTDLPDTLTIVDRFLAWEWLLNGTTYSAGNHTNDPSLIITNTMAPYNTTIELVLGVKEYINGEYCLHYSDTIFLTIVDCPEIVPCSFEPAISINDTSFCVGDNVVLDLSMSDFNYIVGYDFYLDNVLLYSQLNNPIDFVAYQNTAVTIPNVQFADSAALGVNTYCYIVAEDSLLNCTDTLCFSYIVNSCTSTCDSFALNPQFSYTVDSGYLNIRDVSTGIYEVVNISYDGQNYVALPNTTTPIPITDYSALADLCFTIVAFVGDECCKQTICEPIEISCDKLELESNFNYSNAFNSYNFSYAGNQMPTVLLWTFPDGTQLTGNIQTNPHILNPSWYDADNKGGELCLKTIIHLTDSICCVADTCIRLEQNPLSPCRQLEGFTDFTTDVTDHTDFYSVLFTPAVSNQGNYVFQYNKWEINGQTYYNWIESVKFECKEEAYEVEVCLYMHYYDPIMQKECNYRVCKRLRIPACTFYSAKPMIYPNPTNALFTIDMQKMTIKNSSYEIVDMTGKSINKGRILNTKTIVDLKKWTPGVYRVIIKNNEELFMDKIIKN